MASSSNNKKLLAWIDKIKALCRPNDIIWCDGSVEEWDAIWNTLVENGAARRINARNRPNSFHVNSATVDVARVEDHTFICSQKEEDAGPTNNWKAPAEMRKTLEALFSGCMEGRTMYVIPFSMGPIGSNIARIGVQLSDSPYVVASMHIMTRVSQKVLDILGDDGDFVPCLHSVGMPLTDNKQDVAWPCNPDNRYIVHYPETKEIWSFGSGYGGNALLGKKCFALRIASIMARDEGWMAEHMLILKITNPEGKIKYITGSFPSACGKTNLAMLQPTIPGWKIETLGDDIAWLKFGEDGRLYAINPEAGFFGVAPGTGMDTNANAILTLTKNCIFTNVAETDNGDVWWEGMTKEIPEHLIDWQGNDWTVASGKSSSHPNARFTVPASQCPVIADEWEDPNGVPISAILFGGRRASLTPLVIEALDWDHGVFLGSSITSETTSAATGAVGELRRDPMAMLPFCGYNMADYWQHWLNIGKKDGTKMPNIYYVNWFRKDKNGAFMWPGFGENSRILKWIFERCDNVSDANETAIGNVPTLDSIDCNNLNVSKDNIAELMRVDIDGWQSELTSVEEYYKIFGNHLPLQLKKQIKVLRDRLEDSKSLTA